MPGFSETFYAYLSQTKHNGSGFAGYTGYIPPEHSRLDFLTQVLELDRPSGRRRVTPAR